MIDCYVRNVIFFASLALAPISMLSAATAVASQPDSSQEVSPVLVSSAQWQHMAKAGAHNALFTSELARITKSVRAAMANGIQVPVPKDPGGGATHEQHKRNYLAIYGAGALYRLTSDRAYVDYARDLLLAYARLYPTLPPHPASGEQIPGRLFWQILNDSVWLVHACQGYDAIREVLSDADRRTIDGLLRAASTFLASNPDNFDRIHNHGTWAAAGVGMTGYVLRDSSAINKALMGSALDGKTGFLAQIDQLFSPDGYYEEGPYYQRYALAPFLLLANAVQRNEPQRKIFAHRDGVLLKAVNTLVQSSYGGYFFPINDAMLDKGLDTEELVAGIAIAYAQNGDATLLSIAQRQGRTLLSPEGLQVAEALAAGKAKPFVFQPLSLRDGAKGDQGALVILRTSQTATDALGDRGQTLVMKNTAQGMGHGHFDKLSWLFYDNGHAIVRDYGAARFLNIEAKSGGIYLPENKSWAKQTVAHNTLVVDERSHYDGDWKLGEANPPTPQLFAATADMQIAVARMRGAYDGVSFDRTLALLSHPDLGLPIAVDLLRAKGGRPRRFDLPLHFNGHIMTVGFAAQRALATRPVMGKKNGYQHLWVDASSEVATDTRILSWLVGKRFYTYRFGSNAPARAILAESGANDPNFNLRREPVLIQRVDGRADVSFFSVLEPHGEYNGTAEYVYGANSRIQSIQHLESKEADVLVLKLVTGKSIALAVAKDVNADRSYQVENYQWRGGYARFDDGKQSSSESLTGAGQ